jgi:hypothetical protein
MSEAGLAVARVQNDIAAVDKFRQMEKLYDYCVLLKPASSRFLCGQSTVSFHEESNLGR